MKGTFEIISENELLGEMKNTSFYEAKKCFLSRDLYNAIKWLEKAKDECEPNYIEAIKTNLALLYHIVGEYEKAKELYEMVDHSIMSKINFYAFCHRYFEYEKIIPKTLDKKEIPLRDLLVHNMGNYYISVAGNEGVVKVEKPYNVYMEQIINDGEIKKGKSIINHKNEQIKQTYINQIQILGSKNICNEKKRVGIFVTDIQRHKDAAIIFELVDILKEDYEIYIYFNNIFENKLTKRFENNCIIRHVINCSFEEVNNMFFDDEIDVCIDLAEMGLRNNNISLSLFDNILSISELMNKNPILLRSKNYFSDLQQKEDNGMICVLGDMKYISDNELLYIKEYIEDGHRVAFECHAFDECVFKNFFYERLLKLGYDKRYIELVCGILPFKKYLEFINNCSLVIIANGASYIELSEVLFCHTATIVLSENRIIREMAKVYGIIMPDITVKPVITHFNSINDDKINLVRNNFMAEIIGSSIGRELKCVANLKHRISYIENGKPYSINNTCNGDIIIFDEVVGDRSEYFID